jgi:hypothetical protein
MPPPEQQQQQAQAVAMPQVNTNLLSSDDYVYEPKPPEERADTEAQNTASGGMASQFSTVSPALDRNI